MTWLVRMYWLVRGYGGVDLCGRKRVEQLPLFKRVRGVPAFPPWCGPALPHVGGVQHSPEATATGPAPHQNLQAMGSNMAKRSGLGPGDGLMVEGMLSSA